MSKKIVFFGILSCFVLSIVSCRKAGDDGHTTLVITEKHHDRIIPNYAGYPDSIYVKYNVSELPSDPTHNYDIVFVGTAGAEHIDCPNLHTGNYFLYATGWDPQLNVPTGQRVAGGMAIKIQYKNRKKEIDLDLAVTE